MKNLFNDLHNSEKNRILEMHKGATKRNYVSEQEEMKRLVKEAMEKAVHLVVPMEVEMEIAANWLEAH